MVVLENIDKSFGPKKVIQNLSLEVGEGEIFTLLGESGCGKTTLLRLVAGFLQPDGGRILIENEDMLSLPVERRPVGFIFQNHALFPHLSVYDNIAVGPRIRNVPEKETRKQIDALLEAARIQDLKQAYPNQISGGESQRVAIVRAVVNRPKVLLLDEPLSSLDPGLRQSLREELVEMQKTFGLTFFFVTHDQEEALSLSTRIGILESGRLLQVGPPAELYDRPKTPYIAQFLGEVNPLRGGVVRQSGSRVSIQIDGGGLIHCDSREPLREGSRVAVHIRPDDLSLSREPGADERLNQLEGVITSSAFHGGHTRYKVELNPRAAINVHMPHNRGAPADFPRGLKVYVLFHPRSVFLFDESPAPKTGNRE